MARTRHFHAASAYPARVDRLAGQIDGLHAHSLVRTVGGTEFEMIDIGTWHAAETMPGYRELKAKLVELVGRQTFGG